MTSLERLSHLVEVLKKYNSLSSSQKNWLSRQIKLEKRGKLPDKRVRALYELPDFEDYLYAKRLPFKPQIWIKNYKKVETYCKTRPAHERNIYTLCRFEKNGEVIRYWGYRTFKAKGGEIYVDILKKLPFGWSTKSKFSEIIFHNKKFYVSLVNKIIEAVYPAECCGKKMSPLKGTRLPNFECGRCKRRKTLLSKTPFSGTPAGGIWKKGIMLFELSNRNILRCVDGRIKLSSLPFRASAIYRIERKFKELLTTHKAKVKKIIAEESKKWGIKT